MTTVVVIAKECLPGRVKTRLSPPFTPEEAARLAAASLEDTLVTVAALPVARRVLYFDGTKPPVAARGFDLLAQPGGGLDARLAHVFDALDEPTLLVGMDTPQFTTEHVAAALMALESPSPAAPDAWIGPAADGGFWALAMREPRGDVIRGVGMSRADTGAVQRRRLERAGLRIGTIPALADVDTAAVASVIAAAAPDTRFAWEFRRLTVGRSA